MRIAPRSSLLQAPPPFVSDVDFVLHLGDARDVLRSLPDASIDCCVTSPPYWGLRDYGGDHQIGLEATPEDYVSAMVAVFADVRRVLRPAGTLWLNLGDTFSGGRNGAPGPQADVKHPGRTRGWVPPQAAGGTGLAVKNLVGIPWRVALALQADGWILRSDVIWSKPNAMPESVTDRPTKSHEYVFLLAKSGRYFYDADALREPLQAVSIAREGRNRLSAYDVPGQTPQRRAKSGNKERKPNPAAVLGQSDTKHGIPWEDDGTGRNARTVWEIPTQAYAEAHFATFPLELPRRCIAAGCPAGGVVLDPFIGSGTTALAARGLGRRSIGIEQNEEYAALCARRLGQQSLLAEDVA